jgi:hypothetical protein
LIKLTQSEAVMIIEDPNEYIQLSLDCVDKQQSNIPKTHGVKLIESMCDCVHFANMFITKFCCSAINLMMNSSQEEHIYDKDVLQMASSDIFLQSEPTIVVDTCLLILISMSYAIPSRPDLLCIFEDTIELNLQKLIQKPQSSVVDNDIKQAAMSVLLPSHFSLVIGYYGDLLFKKNSTASKMTLQFILDGIAQNEGKLEVVSRSCVDTLSIIVTDNDTLPHMVAEIDMVVEKVIFLIQKVEYTTFYEFLTQFIEWTEKVLVDQHIVRIFDALVDNIVREQEKKLANQEHSKIVMSKGIGVLRKCCRSKNYMRVHF